MKAIELDIDNEFTPSEIKTIIQKQKLTEGDKLQILTSNPDGYKIQLVLIVIIAVLTIFHNKKKNFGDEIIESLFGKYNISEDAEKALENEYGSNAEINIKNSQNTIDKAFVLWKNIKISLSKIRKLAWQIK